MERILSQPCLPSGLQGPIDLCPDQGIRLLLARLLKGQTGFLSAESTQGPGGVGSNQRAVMMQKAFQGNNGLPTGRVSQGNRDIAEETIVPGPLHRAPPEPFTKFLRGKVRQIAQTGIPILRPGKKPFLGSRFLETVPGTNIEAIVTAEDPVPQRSP